jgi:hypothetical protein
MRKPLLLLAATSLAIGFASPAHANDGYAEALANGTSGSVIATASWTDLTDNLCANALNGPPGSYAVAAMIRPDGSTWRTIRDNPGGGPTCTGNLSIAEDQPFTLRVTSFGTAVGTQSGAQGGRFT